MTDQNVQLLAKDVDYMKEKINKIENNVDSIHTKLDNIVRDIFSELEEKYVNKLEFSPLEKKVGSLEKALIWIASTVLLAVVWAILKQVIIW